MSLSISQIIREAKKVVKRKIPGFRSKLEMKELLQNPFVCVMIQCGLVDGELSEKEKFLIRKVVRAAYSFVDGAIIDEILPKAIEQEIKNPTPIGNIVKYLQERTIKAPYDVDNDDKLHIIVFAYMVAMEDAEFNKREEQYIQKLAKHLKVDDIDLKKIAEKTKKEFSDEKRIGNIFRNVAGFSLINVDVIYNDPLFNILIQIANVDESISYEEKEIIKTIICNVYDISRATIDTLFDKAVKMITEKPIKIEKLAKELKESNVDMGTLIKLSYLMAFKSEADYEKREKEKELVDKICKMLDVKDDQVKTYIEEVRELLKKQSSFEYMKGKDVFNSVNGRYIGVIIDETKNKKEWIIKETNGLIYEIDKSKVFVREID
jgi:uncharacterized tellurite resistance protein B-like protein